MSKIRVKDLYEKSEIAHIDEFVFSKEYPWELLGELKGYILKLIEKGLPGYKKLKDDVLVGQDVKIAETATIIGPTIIGNKVEIRPGAYIRGSVLVGDESVIGNSSELKNALLMSHGYRHLV